MKSSSILIFFRNFWVVLFAASLPLQAVDVPATFVRSQAGPYHSGSAVDASTGRFYERTGYSGESTVRVYANAAAYESNTLLTTITLGGGGFFGTYFTVQNGKIFGRNDSASTTVVRWDATTGARETTLASVPGMSGDNFSGSFNWGGYSCVNGMRDGANLYIVGQQTSPGTNWQANLLNPDMTLGAVVTFPVASAGWGMTMQGNLFLSPNYSGDTITSQIVLATGVPTSVSYRITGIGSLYLTNAFYDESADTLYIHNYNSSQIYKIASAAAKFGIVLASAPTVTTSAASGVGSTTATLNGTVNPNGAATDAFFQYSTVSDLSSGVTTTANQPIGSGTSPVAVTQALTGLQPLTTYYFRAGATNSAEPTYGTILNFTTPPYPPVVVTLPATTVVPTGALLNGTVNPNGGSTDVRFAYSTDPGLAGATLTPIQNIGAGTSAVPVSAALTGLVPKTIYYYRAVATNSGGTVNGAILNFTTNVVNWAGSGADAGTGNLDPTLIPTTGTRTFSDVNGQGYYIVVTTANLNSAGSASYFGDPGWWFEGGGPSYGYGTVTFRFFDSATNNPYALSGVDFRLLDAEVNERFRNFGYWDENNNFVSIAYGTGLLTFSNTPIYHATDGSYENNASAQAGDQVGKWIELNLSNLAITGFTFQAHRQTTGAGSVIMSDIISPWAAWRTANFGAPPYPSAADDLANPDNDGSVNILEYFYGSNPNVANAPDPLQTSVQADKLTLTFPRNTAATDTTATVQGADSAAGPWTDLARSINGGPFAVLVGGVTLSDVGPEVIRTVQVSDQYLVTDPLHPTRFLRLQVVH